MWKRTSSPRSGRWLSCTAALALCLLAGVVWAGGTTADPSHDAHQAAGAGAQGNLAHEGHGTLSGELTSNGMTAEEGKAYSLFMHHTSGLALIALGVLLLADRLTQRRYSPLRVGMGTIWLLLGVHILIRADPGGWPLAPVGFLESFSIPAADEWLRHKVLSLVPMALGLYTIVARHARPNPAHSFALAVVMVLGASGLLIHEHLHEPGLDMALIEQEHQVMAVTSFVIAVGSVLDRLERFTWKLKLVLLPLGLILLGLELALYTE